MTDNNNNFALDDVLNQAKNVESVEKKNASKTKKRLVVAGVIALGFVAVLGSTVKLWYTPSDFSNDIPLTENISRWDQLAWNVDGDFNKDLIGTPSGDWVLDETNGVFTNAGGDFKGCQINFNRNVGDFGDSESDLLDTQNYTELMFGEDPSAVTDTVWVPIAGYDTRGVEVARTSFVDIHEKPAVAYYRHSPLNEVIFFGSVRCDDAAVLEKLVPVDSNGEELENFGISLKV